MRAEKVSRRVDALKRDSFDAILGPEVSGILEAKGCCRNARGNRVWKCGMYLRPLQIKDDSADQQFVLKVKMAIARQGP